MDETDETNLVASYLDQGARFEHRKKERKKETEDTLCMSKIPS